MAYIHHSNVLAVMRRANSTWTEYSLCDGSCNSYMYEELTQCKEVGFQGCLEINRYYSKCNLKCLFPSP